MSLPDQWAGGRVPKARIAAAIRRLAEEHPTGPLVSAVGIGKERWEAFAATEDWLPPNWSMLNHWAKVSGTTVRRVVLEALGAEAAFGRGRLRVERPEQAALLVSMLVDDGFSFEPGWRPRLEAFVRGRPYEHVTPAAVYEWSRRYAGGELSRLLDDARGLEHRRRGAAAS